MPKPERDVYIDVYIDAVSPKLKFRVVPSQTKNNPQLPIGPDDEIIFNNDHHPGFRIHFILQGNTHGYFFPPNSMKHDAVWSKVGCVCPVTSRVSEVFHPQSVEEEPGIPGELRKLIVRNPNPSKAQGRFKYNLRVTDDGGTNFLDLDPGGDNQNGPVSRFSGEINALLFGGAIITGVLSAVATTVALARLDLL